MRITILIGILVLLGFPSLAQKGTLRGHIIAVSDSLRLRYPHFHTVYASVDVDMSYDFNKKGRYASVNFPLPSSAASQREVFSLLDSIARTPVFINKVFAHEMFRTIFNYLQKTENVQSAQVTLIQDILKSDIKNCLRLTNASTLDHASAKYFTKEIVSLLQEVLNHVKLTAGEAAIIAQRVEPYYSLHDTIGFARDNKRFFGLSPEAKQEVRRVRNDLYRAREAHQTLARYYDSLNQMRRDHYIEAWTGKQIMSIQQIIHVVGEKRIFKLAPAIEKIYASGLDDTRNSTDIPLILARLRYKTFPAQQLSHYSQLLDSCLQLFSPGRGTDTALDTAALASVMDDVYGKLSYIGTREALRATAPLLLIRAKVLYDPYSASEDRYRIGARFFLKLNQQILNFPWDEAAYKRVEPGQPVHIVDEWYIEHKLPADFLDRMYQWMIANERNYKLNDE